MCYFVILKGPTCPRNSLEDINIEMSMTKRSPLCVFEDVRVENERRLVAIRASDDGNSLPDSRYITISRESQPLIIAEIEVFGGESINSLYKLTPS